MKVNELRAGNWIKIKGDAGWYQVIEIKNTDDQEAESIMIFGGARDYEYHKLKNITGHYITEEILMKAGFIKKKDRKYLDYFVKDQGHLWHWFYF